MADLLIHGVIRVRCGHVSKGACRACITRDLVDPMDKQLTRWRRMPRIEDERASRHHMEMAHQMALNAAMQAQVEAFREALIAERKYHSNNTGKNAARRKAAMAALGKGWEKHA